MHSRTDHTIIEIKDLVFGYDPDEPVIFNLDMKITDLLVEGQTRGQIIVLQGASGSGKSTLLKLIAGLLEPQAGDILLHEHHSDTTLSPTAAGRVGVVYQDSRVFDGYTVERALREGVKQGEIYLDEIDKRVSDIAEEFGLSEHLSKYPAHLSGGQLKRLAIAQQLLYGKQVLLMDEPFTGLDAKSKKDVITAIRRVANRHQYNTIVIITHDTFAGVEIADTLHILGLNEGDLPGASIQHTFDLIETGIALDINATSTAKYAETVVEIQEILSR